MCVNACATPQLYGDSLCQTPGYHCIKVKRHDSWHTLFPSKPERELIKKINRYNDFLRVGMMIAVPDTCCSAIKSSPFPKYIEPINEPLMLISKKNQAWAAYSSDGQLVRWGAASLGKAHCQDEDCQTPSGIYRALSKSGKNCYSKSYPKIIDGASGGAAMPYCIRFHKGYFIHTGAPLPGYPSTHGCVNLFWDDAKWLNETFVQTKTSKTPGTKIQII